MNNKGVMLLIVLIVVLTISLLGTTLFALFFNVQVTSRVELYRTQALYLAEAGLAKAVSALKSKAGEAPAEVSINITGQPELQLIVPRTELGEGSFEVHSNLIEGVLISYGTSNEITRAIQMKYSAF